MSTDEPVPPTRFRLLRVSLLAVAIGVVAGVAAYLLLQIIALLSNLFFYQKLSCTLPNFVDNPVGLWLPLLPILGAFVIGMMARKSPQIRGHGIPEAMEAVAYRSSRIAPRVALLKPLSAAIAIGTGGPFGAEGPIIQTGGAIGSLVGQALRVTACERKVLLACGAAAGMAATFSTPIAAVILAIELLLFEFKSRSFIPLAIATTIATNVHFMLFGWGPLFVVDKVDFGLPGQLPFYLGLGLLAGGAAVLVTRALYWTEDLFDDLPVDPLWRTVLGGALLGAIGLAFPRVLGVGYETITDILNDRLILDTVFAVMVFKLLAMLITLGSGTSGGLLAPTFMVSAAMGSLYAHMINGAAPSAQLAPGAYALAAMAAVFGAASRSTFAFVVFAFEITRNYDAVLPIMLVAVIADGVGLVFLPNSIMTEKLARRGLRIHQEYESDPLQQTTVEQVMWKDVPHLRASTQVADVMNLASLEAHRGLPIVDDNDERRLLGMLNRGDIQRSLAERPDGQTTVLEAGTANPKVAFPDQTLHEAVNRMLRHNLAYLPVVNADQPEKLLGVLGRDSILRAYEKRLDEESRLEAGWLEDAVIRTG